MSVAFVLGFFPLSSSGNSQHFFVCVCVSAKSLSSVDIILVHVYTCSLCIEKIKYDDRLSSKKKLRSSSRIGSGGINGSLAKMNTFNNSIRLHIIEHSRKMSST